MGRLNFKHLALALAAGVCVFHLLTLRQGQGWMDDYAQYVLHARNLAEGRPYSDTGYILNPSYQVTGPVTYPPVFPLLLAPVYALAGADLQAMKALTVLFFAAFLYIAWLLFRDGLGERLALLAAAALGLSPVFWKFKDYLYAEYPFLLFSFAALYAWRQARAAEGAGRRWLPTALAAGLLAYLAYGTRSAGAALLPAFLVSDLVEMRKPSRTFWACCAAALLPAAAQWLTLHGDGVYLAQARSVFAEHGLPLVIAVNVLSYESALEQLFGNGYSSAPAIALLAAAGSFAAGGLVSRAAREPLFAAYTVLNVLLLLLFPSADGLRYAFPVVPFLFYYAFAGWLEYGPRLGRAARRLPLALLLVLAVSYAGAYSRAQYGEFKEGTRKAETRALFDFIASGTRPEDVFVFRKPRTLTLYAGRRAAAYHQGQDPEVLGFFRHIGADYLVVGRIFPEDARFLEPFVRRNSGLFSEVYSNADFRVYRLAPGDAGRR